MRIVSGARVNFRIGILCRDYCGAPQPSSYESVNWGTQTFTAVLPVVSIPHVSTHVQRIPLTFLAKGAQIDVQVTVQSIFLI